MKKLLIASLVLFSFSLNAQTILEQVEAKEQAELKATPTNQYDLKQLKQTLRKSETDLKTSADLQLASCIVGISSLTMGIVGQAVPEAKGIMIPASGVGLVSIGLYTISIPYKKRAASTLVHLK